MEVCVVDQCVESDVESIEKLVDFVIEIPNLVNTRIKIGFHDQLVMSNMEIVEHLVVGNQLAKGDDSYVADIDIADVDSLVANVVEDLNDTADLCFPYVDLLVDFMFEDIVVVGCDQS